MSENRRDIARNLGLKRAAGEAYYRRALQAFEADNYDDAIVDISEALYYDPGYAEYYAARGLCFYRNGQQADAERDIAYALQKDRRNWLGHYVYGLMRFNEGRYHAAIQHFDDAIRFQRHKAELYYFRAVAHYALNMHEKAAPDIEKALQLFDTNDKRVREARLWKKEIDSKQPQPTKASRPTAKKARGRKDSRDLSMEVPVAEFANQAALEAKARPLESISSDDISGTPQKGR